jgi:hypothetical protein
MALHEKLALLSIRLSKAFDRAAMSVAYGEEAAHHYNERYTSVAGLRGWVSGFREGWSGDVQVTVYPVETCDKVATQPQTAPSYGSDQVNS